MAPRIVQREEPEALDAKKARLYKAMTEALGRKPSRRDLDSLPEDRVQFLLDFYGGDFRRHIY
jgi:hypothetical protein